jgi:hypothetical protein
MRPASALSCLPAVIALTACAGPPLPLTPAASAAEGPPVVALLPLANEDPHPEAVNAGRKIRWAIYTVLASRQEEYSVALQDVAETDRRLVAAGLTDSAAVVLPTPDLCRPDERIVPHHDTLGIQHGLPVEQVGAHRRAHVHRIGRPGKLAHLHPVHDAGGGAAEGRERQGRPCHDPSGRRQSRLPRRGRPMMGSDNQACVKRGGEMGARLRAADRPTTSWHLAPGT